LFDELRHNSMNSATWIDQNDTHGFLAERKNI
jgi:hypothetical protein